MESIKLGGPAHGIVTKTVQRKGWWGSRGSWGLGVVGFERVGESRIVGFRGVVVKGVVGPWGNGSLGQWGQGVVAMML